MKIYKKKNKKKKRKSVVWLLHCLVNKVTWLSWRFPVTYTFYFLLSWTLFKNSKNIRLWHSLCFKDFLFLLGISKKVTWLCLPDNGEATRHFFFSFFYSFFCKFSFFFLQTTHLYNYYSFKKCNTLYVYFIYSFQVSIKSIWSVKMNVKSLKNILIVNNNFMFTIGLPYCYLPFKVIFRTHYFHEILWPISHVLLICMHKNKGHNYYYSTSEWRSSYKL
jgi:hypothetical protein